MSVLLDTETKRRFIDNECSPEQRFMMHKENPDKIYECCCREKNRVKLKLGKSLKFYPVDRTQVHELDCERSSEYQEEMILNYCLLPNGDGTYIVRFQDKETNSKKHNNISRIFPTINNLNKKISFDSFAKRINLMAYERMLKTNRKDKNGNHSTIDRKYIERYIWSMLNIIYSETDDGLQSLYEQDSKDSQGYRFNYHMIDMTRAIEKKQTKLNTNYYVVPIVNLKGFGADSIIINEKDYLKGVKKFEEEYKVKFDSNKYQMMVFIKGEKKLNSNHDINPWHPSKICFYIISWRGLYSKSPLEAEIYTEIEKLLLKEESKGHQLQFYKPYEYRSCFYGKDYLEDGIIKQTFKDDKRIIIEIFDESADWIEREGKKRYLSKNRNKFVWSYDVNEQKRLELSDEEYMNKKIEELRIIIEEDLLRIKKKL